ncbi:MAG: outer membrane beta-barrel protein [Candidatus Zixiibacteriota bacterium]|nr:MAG: outer membrane beta-barrel protein [candidate division Zixibacteria bacterium]
MKRCVILMLIVVVGMAASASAFDGARKGFVLGGGLGFAPVAKYDWPLWEENRSGFALNLVIGHAWDEFNMIVYEGNVTSFSSGRGSVTFAQGFNGACWYHYFGPTGKSFYTAAGLGFYVFRGENAWGYEFQNDPGFGILVGTGYEFARHWQVGAYLSAGKTDAGLGVEMDHSHFSILVSSIAF